MRVISRVAREILLAFAGIAEYAPAVLRAGSFLNAPAANAGQESCCCGGQGVLILFQPMKPEVVVLPSLLAGDFGHLATSALQAQEAGGDALHLDIMDGHFVPNISMGPEVVRMAHRLVKIPLNVHLMLSRPDWLMDAFIDAGAQTLLIHVEAPCDVVQTLRRIRDRGIHPGLALNPETPFEAALPFINAVDEILFMTVHPGFGGQQFMPEVLPKILACRRYLDRWEQGSAGQRPCDIAVDGGIDLNTVSNVAAAGANALVAGSALFRSKNMAVDIAALRQKAKDHLPG